MQNQVKEFNQKYRSLGGLSPENRILDIQSELGELSKEVLKSTNYGKTKFQTTEDFVMEFGDTLYSILCLANETNIDAKEALEKVLNKYESRFSKKGTFGSAEE